MEFMVGKFTYNYFWYFVLNVNVIKNSVHHCYIPWNTYKAHRKLQYWFDSYSCDIGFCLVLISHRSDVKLLKNIHVPVMPFLLKIRVFPFLFFVFVLFFFWFVCLFVLFVFVFVFCFFFLLVFVFVFVCLFVLFISCGVVVYLLQRHPTSTWNFYINITKPFSVIS